MDPVVEAPQPVPVYRVVDHDTVGPVPFLRPDGVETSVAVRVYLQPGGVAADLILPLAAAHRIGHELIGLFHPPTASGVDVWPGPSVWVDTIDG